MTEMTIAAPLSGEDVIEACFDHQRQMLVGDCHLNPALAYEAFEAEITMKVKLFDQGREVEVEYTTRTRGGAAALLEKVSAAESFRQLHKLPPNTVREAAGIPIPTLTEDSTGKKEVRGVKYGRMSASGPGGTQQDPGKQPQPPNPHPPGTPEHEKHERERKEREEREKKEHDKR